MGRGDRPSSTCAASQESWPALSQERGQTFGGGAGGAGSGTGGGAGGQQREQRFANRFIQHALGEQHRLGGTAGNLASQLVRARPQLVAGQQLMVNPLPKGFLRVNEL